MQMYDIALKLGVISLVFAWLAPHAQAAIQVFTDRAAFTAATGATSATGPLPDLGAIAPPVYPASTVTLGDITFSLGPGGDNFAIGGAGVSGLPKGDWYELTFTNEMAFGFESLRTDFAEPIYSFGFEIIEPNATVEPWGGSPVDSTFQVTLLAGDTIVGQFQFNAPDDDVDAFIGVWSDVLFDAATVIDITDSPFVDDDEYFGEFYTGATPLVVTPACPGDVNGDNTVGLADVAAIINCWSFPAACNPSADLDVSGDIGLGDVAIVIQHWGETCS